jgi:hypothetical protein
MLQQEIDSKDEHDVQTWEQPADNINQSGLSFTHSASLPFASVSNGLAS